MTNHTFKNRSVGNESTITDPSGRVTVTLQGHTLFTTSPEGDIAFTYNSQAEASAAYLCFALK